jgi:hypothetical protein
VASDTMSLSSGGVLPVITTKEARSRWEQNTFISVWTKYVFS